VLDTVDLDEAEIDNRGVAFDDRAFKSRRNLETDWCTVLYLDEEVRHVITALSRRDLQLEVDLLIFGLNDAFDQTAALLE
jgi:hypothetical protein